jgi:hypothetical protein
MLLFSCVVLYYLTNNSLTKQLNSFIKRLINSRRKTFGVMALILYSKVQYGCTKAVHYSEAAHYCSRPHFQNTNFLNVLLLTARFGPKREEVYTGWRTFHNVDVHNLYSTSSIVLLW